ncbi:glycerol dehydrogenase [Lacrimispora sp.]|uniref:glycerol dehydrogenase n=1 Tax=Lacrimispora sp. TaxID=2719234 RepID=UPI002FD8D053
MKKIITSPGSYIQGSGELKNLVEYYQALGSKGAYMIVDKFIYDTYKSEIVKSFEENNVLYEMNVFGGECSRKEIELHREKLGVCDVVIGIGGGKTLDASKAVSFYSHLPVIIVPTAASTDAPCSRLSVVYKENGEFESYLPLTSNPDMVIMDTEVIAKAPVRFLAAGIGDALATYYEASACEKADAVSMAGGRTTKAALALAKLCRDTLLEDGVKAKLAVESKVCTKAVENIVEANTYLSGIGFESSGLSAAHAIHNGLTVLEECHHMLHGEKVAFGTITQLVLENRSMEEIQKIIRFCQEIGLPTSFKDLGIDQVSDEKLMEAAKASCADNDTMGNMPFEVSPEDVLAAMKVADKLGRE